MKLLVGIGVVAALCAPAAAAPAWCKGAPTSDRADAEQVKQALSDYKGTSNTARFIIKAAKLACSAPNAPSADILAAWKKESGLDDQGAIASLEARASATWEGDFEKLCKALPFANGDRDDTYSRNEARQSLFTCDSNDTEGAWMHDAREQHGLATMLDRGVLERDNDELLRLMYVNGEVRHMLDPNEGAKVLANYAVVQFDIKALRPEAVMKQLETAPYRGNRYARTIVIETLANTKANIARLETVVAAKTKDATWKNLIITVPQQAARDWLAAADKYKDMLSHGKGSSGCDTLRDDVSSLMKPLAAKSADISVIEGKLNENPIAGLVIWRWAHCIGDQTDDTSKMTAYLSENVPPLQGPREAAFRAVMTAVAGQKKAPFDYHDINDPERMHWSSTGGGPSGLSRGVVKSVAKKKDGLYVTFASDKFKYMERACKDSKQIDRVDDEGRVWYRKECHDAGMAVGDNAPQPATIDPRCTAGIAKGRFVFIDWSQPWLVYADKSSKKLVAAYCIPLE